MIDRNVVAKEKMARAKELMNQYSIDMWVIYARGKRDTALELMFNTDTKMRCSLSLPQPGSGSPWPSRRMPPSTGRPRCTPGWWKLRRRSL